MDHIVELDWGAPSGDTRPYLVSEEALDNCCIEKILRNEFRDPLLSSEDEDDEPNNINWDAIFKTRALKKASHIYVPGNRPLAPYPKLSVLTGIQHYHILKVLCAKNPHVLPEQHINRPISRDYKLYETLSQFYEKEQKEFIEWAKSQWTLHCSRAIKPDPIVEMVYEKELNMRAQRLRNFPKKFDMAAQIPLQCDKKHKYEVTSVDNLITVNLSELPLATVPNSLSEYTSIIKPCNIPEPCYKHPYQFILPNENSPSILPITELHRELAQYAVDNGTRLIASENALKCLISFNRYWVIPITVCSVFGPDGNECNVVVLDSGFNVLKEPAMIRTYKAFRHLIHHTLVPTTEMEKIIENHKKNKKLSKKDVPTATNTSHEETELSSDDEDLSLVIHEDNDDDDNGDDNDVCMKEPKDDETEDNHKKDSSKDIEDVSTNKDINESIKDDDIPLAKLNDIVGVYSCTCKDTLYELPPQRSYKKWRFTNTSTSDSIDVIVHCSHKAKMDKSKEIIIEPIPEYQLELGGCEQLPDNIKCTVLSLILRKNVTLLKARIDGSNGEIVTLEPMTSKQYNMSHNDIEQQILNTIQNTLSDIQGLLPGHYLMRHEPSHGANALLYVSRPNSTSFTLNFDLSQLAEPDETKAVTTPPTIGAALLPFHKSRKILPCAFTPHNHQIMKERKKPPPPPKPQTSKYPKRKNRWNKK